MAGARRREYAWYEALALLLAMIGVQLSSELFAQWGFMFYSPPPGTGRIVYVGVALASVIFIAGRIFDTITDPLIGSWSDNTRSTPSWRRLIPIGGRRRPFIFWGAVLMAFTSIAFWFPPVAGESLNLAYGAFIMCLHWLFFTVCVVPLNSLAPEIARSRVARVRIGQWIAAGMILGLAVANIAPPILIERLDPERAASVPVLGDEGGVELSHDAGDEDRAEGRATYSAKGYQRTAMVFAVVSLVVLLLPVLAIRERYDSGVSGTRAPAFREMMEALKNPVFVKYLAAFFIFMVGYMAVQKVLLPWTVVGLGGSEGTIVFLMGPYILSCLFTALVVMPFLSKWLPNKWLWLMSFMIIATGLPAMYPIAAWDVTTPLLSPEPFESWMGMVGTHDVVTANKVLLAGLLFTYCGVGQGIQYVVAVALIGEIIDLDEQTSGERREAIYNGLSGIAFKMGYACCVGVAGLSMHLLGNTVERPYGIYVVGPIAGVLGLVGIVIVWNYPVLKVTPERTEDLVSSGPAPPAAPQ